MARDPLDDLLDDIAPAEGDSVTAEDVPAGADPLDDLLSDLQSKPRQAAAPAAPTRADLSWTTSLYDVPPAAGGTVKPPPVNQPRTPLEAGLQQFNDTYQPVDVRNGMSAPPPLGQPQPKSFGRVSPQKMGKITGNELPEQSRAMQIAEPVLRPLVGAGASFLQMGQDAAQLMGAGWGKKPIFNSKTFLRDLETLGIYGEANFWDRVSQRGGEIGAQVAGMNTVAGALTKAGVTPFIAQQVGMGAVGAVAASAEAQRSGQSLSTDDWLSMAIDNVVTYPLFALGLGEATKGLLKNTRYAASITPAASAAVTGAAFEGMHPPAPGESRLENMLAGAAAFGLDASVRHNFPGLTRSFRERGAKKQTGFAAEALEAGTDGKRTPQQDAELQAKTARSRAEEFVPNFIALSRMAGLDPYAKGQSHSLTAEMVVGATGTDLTTAAALVSRHRAMKPEATKEITTNMVKERVVEIARKSGGEAAADEMRYRLGLMDPFERRRYQTSGRGENSEIGYQKQNPKQQAELMKEARESLKAEFLDQFMAQRTGDLENAKLRAGEQEQAARTAQFERERRTREQVETARNDMRVAARIREEVRLAEQAQKDADERLAHEAMLKRVKAKILEEKTQADIAAMEKDLAPPEGAPTPAEQLRAELQLKEFGPKFEGRGQAPPVEPQEPPPPGARAASKYRRTGPPIALPVEARGAAETDLVPQRPRRGNKKKAQRALNETVRRLAPTEVRGPLREIPAPPIRPETDTAQPGGKRPAGKEVRNRYTRPVPEVRRLTHERPPIKTERVAGEMTEAEIKAAQARMKQQPPKPRQGKMRVTTTPPPIRGLLPHVREAGYSPEIKFEGPPAPTRSKPSRPLRLESPRPPSGPPDPKGDRVALLQRIDGGVDEVIVPASKAPPRSKQPNPEAPPVEKKPRVPKPKAPPVAMPKEGSRYAEPRPSPKAQEAMLQQMAVEWRGRVEAINKANDALERGRVKKGKADELRKRRDALIRENEAVLAEYEMSHGLDAALAFFDRVSPKSKPPEVEPEPVAKKPRKPAPQIPLDRLNNIARKAFDVWDSMDPGLRPELNDIVDAALRKAKSSLEELHGRQLEQQALEEAGYAPHMGNLNRTQAVEAARAQVESAQDALYMDETISGMLGGTRKEYEGMTEAKRNRKIVEKYINENWDSIFASAPEAINYIAKKYGRKFGPMVDKAVDAATRPIHEVSADIEKKRMPREERAVKRAKVILGDKAEKSPEAPPASPRDKRIADKLADAVERHNQREEVEEKARNRRRKGGRKGDSGKYIAYGLAGAVAGTILASDDEDAKRVALAGLPFVFFPRGRKPLVGRLPEAERAAAAEWARTPLDRGPLKPAHFDAKLAFSGEPGPRRIERIIEEIFPEIGVGEDRVFRPVQQPRERKVQYLKNDLEVDLGREHVFQGSDVPGVTPPHQPSLFTRKLQSASHALTQFGSTGEALNRGINFVEQAVNTRAGRALFEYKRTIVEAQQKSGLKDDFTQPMSRKETEHFEAFWEHVVDGKAMPKDVQENANTKVRVVADWASRMILGRRVAGLTKEEAIVSDALTKYWADALAATGIEATDAIPKWVELPNYGLPVVIAPEAMTPPMSAIGKLGTYKWQKKYERAIALQEKIIDEAIEARPGLTRAQVRDHLSKMSGMAEDPLFNVSIGEPEASHANFLDRHRLLDVKSGRVLDPIKLFDMYFPNIIRRIEMARMWGGDMELARDILDVAKGDRQNTDAMGTLFDIASNQAPKIASQTLDNISAMVSVKSLGKAGIRQLSTWANELKYPVRYRDGLKALNDSFRYAVSESHLPKAFRDKFYNEEHDLFVHEMGTAMRNEYSHVLASLSGVVGKGTHMILKYPYLVTPLDRLPRLKASMWARRSVHALIPEIEHAVRTGNMRRFGNDRYWQDVARELWQDPAVQKIALKPTHTAAEIEALKINAAEWLVARTNGRSEPRDMGAVMQHPIGKQMFKFQQFNIRATAEWHRQWNFFDKKSTINNKAAQMRLLAGTAASLGLGYGIYRALSALRRDDKDDPIAKQVMETLSGAGMYPSIIAGLDLFSGSYHRDAREKILGPTFGAVADATQAGVESGIKRNTDPSRAFLIANMPEPFWGPWFGIPTRKDLREDEKERRKLEKKRKNSGF